VRVHSEQGGPSVKQRLISIDELARITDTEPSWWQVRIRHGEIPVVKLGRHVRLRLQDVEEVLDRGYPPRKRNLKDTQARRRRWSVPAVPDAALDPSPEGKTAGERD
jgi:excisionase family DNA binding protein